MEFEMAPRSVHPTTERWNGGPGTYFQVTRADGAQSAMLNCPECGTTASLGDHTIASDGTVTPSVVCPSAGCAFHDYVRLIDWGKR